jgi:hypothetical protein
MPVAKTKNGFISLEDTPLKRFSMAVSELMLIELAENITHRKCTKEQMKDWLVVYEWETGDTSLRGIEDLPEDDLVTYLS